MKHLNLKGFLLFAHWGGLKKLQMLLPSDLEALDLQFE